MNTKNLYTAIIFSIIWLYVVVFLAYPNLYVKIFNWCEFKNILKDIKIKEINSILIEKRAFIIAFLAAFEFIIICITEDSSRPRTKSQCLLTLGVFLGAIFMQAYFETIPALWPYLLLILMILIIKVNTLMTFISPSRIKISKL